MTRSFEMACPSNDEERFREIVKKNNKIIDN